MTLRIYVDVQAVQGPFHERGIARYVSDLAVALERASAPIVAFGLNPTQPAPASLHHGLLASPRLTWNTATSFRALLDEGPLVYLTLSPFEGYYPVDSVWPAYVLDSGCPLVGVVYDVIPYQDPVTYQPRRMDEDFYLVRRHLLAHLERFLAISGSAAREFAAEFDVDPSRITTIGTGVASRYGRAADPRGSRQWVYATLPAIARPFVLCVGGPDERKNVEGLIAAWAEASADVRRSHQLVVACHVNGDVRERWETRAARHGLQPDDVVVTGFVDDRTLVALYQTAELMVFPSRLEGFGLPVAEAIACGCPAITSDGSSLPEVIQWEPSTFDPEDTDAMAALVERALTDETYRAELVAACDAAAPRHSWDRVVERVLAALETVPAHATRRRLPRRIALIGAYPPDRSDDALTNAELVGALAGHANVLVDVFVDGEVVPASLGDPERRFPIGAYGRHLNPARYDVRLYSLADRPGLARTYRAALEHRGDVWLHDVGLTRLVLAGEAEPWTVLGHLYGDRIHSTLRPLAQPSPERLARAGMRLLGDIVGRAQRIVVHGDVAARQVALDIGPLRLVTPVDAIPIVREPALATAGPGSAGDIVVDGARLDRATAQTVLGALALIEGRVIRVVGTAGDLAAIAAGLRVAERVVVCDESIDWTSTAVVVDVSAETLSAPARLARLALSIGRPVVTNLAMLAHLAGRGVVAVAGDATAEMLAAGVESAIANPPPADPTATWTIDDLATHLIATIGGRP